MNYTSIKLPIPLKLKILEIIKDSDYRSVSEYVIDSVRKRIKEENDKMRIL